MAGLFDESTIDGGGVPDRADGKKPDWKRLAPILAMLPFVLKTGGRSGAAGLLQGYQAAQDRRRTQGRQDQQDAETRDYRQAQLSSLDEQRQATRDNADTMRRQTFLQQFGTGLDKLDTPEAVQAYLTLQGAQGQSLGIGQDELTAMAPTPTALERRKAAKALEALQKQRPEDWMNWSATIDGQPVKATDLLSISRNADAPPEAGPDLRKSSLDVQAAAALAAGDTKTYGRLLRVKKEMGLADNSPRQGPDPETVALRRETAQANLSLLKQRVADATGKASGVKLSPTQQNDLADAKTLSDLAADVMQSGVDTDWAGTGGLGYGSMADWMAKNLGAGSQDAAGLRANISNIQATIAKLRGGTSFTPNEQKLLEQYTPTVNNSPRAMIAKLKNLQEFVAKKAENMIAAASRGAGDMAGDMRRNADAPPPGKTSTKKVGRFTVEVGP